MANELFIKCTNETQTCDILDLLDMFHYKWYAGQGMHEYDNYNVENVMFHLCKGRNTVTHTDVNIFDIYVIEASDLLGKPINYILTEEFWHE